MMQRSLRLLLLGVALLFLTGCRRSGEVQPTDGVEEASALSGLSVAELVEQLVSPTPPKYPDLSDDIPSKDVMEGGFVHPQVDRARTELVSRGTKVYPELGRFLADERHSYSGVSAAWLNHSVGDMVKDILAEGIEFSGYGYKSRKNATGSNGEPHFEAMVSETGWVAYAERASGMTKAALQKEFVAWKLERERKHGFTDANQEASITAPYIKWLSEH